MQKSYPSGHKEVWRWNIGVLRLEDLLAADEAFFTGTATEVTPISVVDGTKIGRGGTPGLLTEQIQRTFCAATSGRDQRYNRWLHYVAPQLSKSEKVL